MPAPISFDRRRESIVSYSNSYSGMLSVSAGQNWFKGMDDNSCYADQRDADLPHLEADFCKDFSCCGLVLDDLHDLLQHYEDHHVKMDELQLLSGNIALNNPHAGSARPHRPDLGAMKRKALLEMQRHLGQTEAVSEEEMAFEVNDPFSRKRSWRPSMSSPSMATRDFFTPSQSPMSTPNSSSPSTPVMGVAHDFHAESDNPLLFGPPSSSADWLATDGHAFRPMSLLKKARQTPAGYPTATVGPQVIEHPASNLVVVDKPYKCQIPGCDKAYKNQNGLKYHKMHGNCASNPAALMGEGAAPSDLLPHYENKPYKCNLCNKRYKNLNGLKYHTAHSHQNVTTDSIQTQLAQGQTQKMW